MRFKLKPHTEPRAPRTPAQEAATNRNMRIFQLRGLAAHRYLLTGKRREQFAALIDRELKAMGAKTMIEQAAEMRAKWEAEEAAAPEDERIPF